MLLGCRWSWTGLLELDWLIVSEDVEEEVAADEVSIEDEHDAVVLTCRICGGAKAPAMLFLHIL